MVSGTVAEHYPIPVRVRSRLTSASGSVGSEWPSVHAVAAAVCCPARGGLPVGRQAAARRVPELPSGFDGQAMMGREEKSWA